MANFKYNAIQEIPSLLFIIDFEKAFESVSWSFIDHELHMLNLKIIN